MLGSVLSRVSQKPRPNFDLEQAEVSGLLHLVQSCGRQPDRSPQSKVGFELLEALCVLTGSNWNWKKTEDFRVVLACWWSKWKRCLDWIQLEVVGKKNWSSWVWTLAIPKSHQIPWFLIIVLIEMRIKQGAHHFSDKTITGKASFLLFFCPRWDINWKKLSLFFVLGYCRYPGL